MKFSIKHLFQTCLVSMSLIATSAWADFDLTGDLTITYPTGQSKKVEMPISYKASEYDHKFRVGAHEHSVTGRPEKYSFAVLLQKNNFVWIQEFNKKGYFESFDWTIGKHKLKLKKEILSKPVKGDYILTVNGTDYFFQNKLAQINLLFDEDGIKDIEIDGMVASLGLNKAKSEECTAAEESEENSENTCPAEE